MALFEEFVSLATQFGIFEFYLPFLILFSLFYGLLSKMKLFGNPFAADKEARLAKAINLIFSLAAALFLMVYTPLGFTLTQFFATMFGHTMVIITTIICAGMVIYLLSRMAGVDIFERKDKWSLAAIILGSLIAIGLFVGSAGFGMFPDLLPTVGIPAVPSIVLPALNITAQDVMLIALILITILAIWFVAHGEKEVGSKTTS